MNFQTSSELFKFLFPIENMEDNDVYAVSNAVADDEFDELPNLSNAEDIIENVFIDNELV